MKKNGKLKELLSNKEAVIGGVVVLAMVVIAIIQFVIR